MKHIQPYTEFINESQLEPYNVGKGEFVTLVMDRVPERSEPFTAEEMKQLVALYNYLDPDKQGEWAHKQDSTYDRRFKITPNHDLSHHMGLWIGKNTDGTWSLQTSDQQGSYAWKDEYYILPTLAELVALAASKFKPIEWDQIR